MKGRGDDSMTMLEGYAHMVAFFTSFDWWDTEPQDEFVSDGTYCLAKPGESTPSTCRIVERRRYG